MYSRTALCDSSRQAALRRLRLPRRWDAGTKSSAQQGDASRTREAPHERPALPPSTSTRGGAANQQAPQIDRRHAILEEGRNSTSTPAARDAPAPKETPSRHGIGSITGNGYVRPLAQNCGPTRSVSTLQVPPRRTRAPLPRTSPRSRRRSARRRDLRSQRAPHLLGLFGIRRGGRVGVDRDERLSMSTAPGARRRAPRPPPRWDCGTRTPPEWRALRSRPPRAARTRARSRLWSPQSPIDRRIVIGQHRIGHITRTRAPAPPTPARGHRARMSPPRRRREMDSARASESASKRIRRKSACNASATSSP